MTIETRFFTGATEPVNAITAPGGACGVTATSVICGGTVARTPGETTAGGAGSPRNTARSPPFPASATVASHMPLTSVVAVPSSDGPRVALRRWSSTVAPGIGTPPEPSVPATVTVPGALAWTCRPSELTLGTSF